MKHSKLPEIPMITDENVKNYSVRLTRYANEGRFKLRLNERKYFVQQYFKFVKSEMTKLKFYQAAAYQTVGSVKMEFYHTHPETKEKTMIIDMDV